MAAASPVVVPPNAQEKIIEYERWCYRSLAIQWNIRDQLRFRDLAYMRENDFTTANWRARLAEKYGDPTRYRNIVVPIIYPQVESAVTYQSSVFLTGVPIFGWVAPPGQENEAQQFQAITEENQIRGGWIDQFMQVFRDGFKYNLAISSINWDRINTWAVETDPSFDAGRTGKPKQTVWQGNCFERWDPYNSFWDTRVRPTELYKSGEFAGTTKILSRVALKLFLDSLPDGMVQNYGDAFKSGFGSAGVNSSQASSYYIPQINPDSLVNLSSTYTFDWTAWAGLSETQESAEGYKSLFEVTTLYARIIPTDFKLFRVPSPKTVQIWKFIVVNHQVVVYAERQTNVHANLPVFITQPNNDGLGYQTKSLADNAAPFQSVATALMNSVIASRRRAISDRMIYDPSLISEAHINNDSPTAKIPLRMGGYGKPLEQAVYQIPFRDDQAGIALQEVSQMMSFADKINGQNPARQGQFVKGNKTLHEYADVMQNANGRDQMTALSLEVQLMTPVKEIIKANILQYQGTGEIYSSSLKQSVPIDPVALRASMVTFKISDGLVPTDKVISADELGTALQVIGSSPAIGAGYNVAPLFSYLMQTRNVDLEPFEKSPQQQVYEQALNSWSQTAQLAIQKGVQFSTPQPTPQQYGYDPSAQDPDDAQNTQVTPTNLSKTTTGAPNNAGN